jgi:solute carrier family 25 carnitine/acylcarnitine transporter 20/29
MTAQFLAGGTAGTVQWLPPIYCFDVIKSRMQTAPQGFYKNLGDCATKLYREHGMAVFFR